jgi:putative Holliday junction resolvase
MITQKPILAIDYGQKRFGLAISDSKGVIATPLSVLEVKEKNKTEKIIAEILEILQEYRIKTILIGKPQVFQEGYEKTAKKIEKFKEQLEQKTTLPIIYQDESYSTATAQNMLLSLGQNTKSTKGKIDMIAATVFLQEFLNSEERNNV